MSVLNFPASAGRMLLASAPTLSPMNVEHTGLYNSYVNQGHTEYSDLVVILAAILCALICALGINSFVLCCSRWMRGAESSNEINIWLANTRLKKVAMQAFPIIVYRSGSKLLVGLATEFSICLAAFTEGEKLRVFPKCTHGFHMECIDKWFTWNFSCPLCRHCLYLGLLNKKPACAAIARAAGSNCNAIHVAIETADLTQAIPQCSETLERSCSGCHN